jgi:protein-S-isoprenylcysteine O-methyltransferase Ste14
MFFALRQYNLSEFSGFSYLKEKTKHQAENLNTSGLNAYVRHPLYFASLIFFWGLFLAVPNNAVLVLAIISTFYLIVGTMLEEKKLVKIFGEEYIAYQKRVPMLFPAFANSF